MKIQEQCDEVVVFFKDYGTNQLYTIAFAEDEDFASSNSNVIKAQ